ncbi:MAG: flagellar hook-basal body protein [candidate division Zixibacteria bacterium]
MIKGIHTSANGMLPHMRKQELIANNLANATTPGFKREMLFTKELTKAQQKQLPSRSDWEVPMIDKTYTDFSSGGLDHTTNPLDLAIDGDGFFVLEDLDGNRFFSRSGHFTIDSEGFLAFPGGYRLAGEGGPIQVGQGTLSVGADGTVEIDGLRVDRVLPQSVNDVTLLDKVGGSLFAIPEGEALIPAFDASVRQGYVESANVDVVAQMVDMISTYRAYEANARAMQDQDQSLDHLFGRVAGRE